MVRVKKEEKEKAVVCIYCGEWIDPKGYVVILATKTGNKILGEEYFHEFCFNKWFSFKVNEKAKFLLKEEGKNGRKRN